MRSPAERAAEITLKDYTSICCSPMWPVKQEKLPQLDTPFGAALELTQALAFTNGYLSYVGRPGGRDKHMLAARRY
jgi:hypothetical protein